MANGFGDIQVEGRLVPATLRGFRQWYIQRQEGRECITSLRGTLWPNAQLIAKCPLRKFEHYPVLEEMGVKYDAGSQPHEAPKSDCICGIYCLNFQADWTNPIYPDQRLVSGVVKCGGKVAFGTLGFRAQEAAIEAVHLAPPNDYYQYRFREQFKAEYPHVLVFTRKEEMYEQYPPDDFSSLYPEEVLKMMADDRKEFLWRNRRR